MGDARPSAPPDHHPAFAVAPSCWAPNAPPDHHPPVAAVTSCRAPSPRLDSHPAFVVAPSCQFWTPTHPAVDLGTTRIGFPPNLSHPHNLGLCVTVPPSAEPASRRHVVIALLAGPRGFAPSWIRRLCSSPMRQIPVSLSLGLIPQGVETRGPQEYQKGGFGPRASDSPTGGPDAFPALFAPCGMILKPGREMSQLPRGTGGLERVRVRVDRRAERLR